MGAVARFAITDAFPLLTILHARRERAGESVSSSFASSPVQEFSSSVVCAACLHICKTHSTVWHVHQFVYSSLSVSVCGFCLCFSYPNAICLFPIHPFKSWQQRRCGHWQGAEWKTELRRSPSVLLSSYYSFYPPQSLSPVPPPAWCLPRGGAGPVRASRCPCISCAEWRPGP